MSGNEKDQNDNNLCNKHTTRCDKDQRAICPSKLSKSELEDLYFTLLNNNLQLKRTINAQNEKNRILSTKVQRMTAQTRMYGGAGKECCASVKAIINEQKATISDLKRSNEAMTDRIRKLSTQLCTAKQFLKQNPNSRTCYKCYVNANTAKNQSSISLHNKTSEVCTIIKSGAASAIFPDREPLATTKTTESNTTVHEHEHDDKRIEKACIDSRCRATMEALKQKIVDLEEELARTHAEYSSRMSQLETEVHVLQTCAVQARKEHTTRTGDDVLGFTRRLKDAAADKAELEAQLSFEKKRVVELGMLVKAAELSQKVAKAMEGHLVTVNRLEEKQFSSTSEDRCRYCSAFFTDPSPRTISMKASPMKQPVKLAVPVDPRSKDDSGYADVADCCRAAVSDTKADKVNEWLKKRISEMQKQLDNLKLASADTFDTERDVAPCCKTSRPYAEKLCSEKEHKYPIIVSQTPEVCTCEIITSDHDQNGCDPDTCTGYDEKLDNLKLASAFDTGRDIAPSGKTSRPHAEELSNEKERKYPIIVSKPLQACTCEIITSDHDQNGCNSDTYTGYDEKRKLDDSSKEKESSVNEEGHGLNLSKQSRERFSSSVSKQEVEFKSNPKDKIVDEVSNTKSQVTQEILDYRKVDYDSEIKPETPRENIKDESNTTDPSISHIPNLSTIKHDDHDSHQILGPLPVPSNPVSKQNKTGTSNWKKAKLHGKKKGINVVEDTNKTDEIGKTPVAKKDEFMGGIVKKLKNKKNNKSKNVDNSESENLTRTYDVKKCRKNKDSVIQSKHFNQKRKQSREEKEKLDKVNEFAAPNNAVNDNKRPKDQLVIEAGDCDNKTSQLDESAKKQKISKVDEFGSVLNPPVGTSTPNAVRSPTPPHTYTVDSKGSRASPDNTDHEISGMTDLPTEKDAATPRDVRSPGEHRTTGTSTESYSFYNDVTLSEGEVPAGKYSIRRMSKSMGEVRSMNDAKEYNSIGERRSSADKMEEALQAISQELARCRSLLHRPRPSEQRKRIDIATSFERHRDSVTLQKNKAKSSVETSCLFILHISTILLADEVVTKSSDALMLTWKFLNLSTVTHMHVGPVIDIGFTTRYKIQVNKNSMDYFRNEDMLMVICEDGNEDKALATCTLPLHEVLAQANRRFDLTLPLRAGPCMNEQTSNTNSGNDVGLVDLWCILSCDSRHLDSINVITQNTGEYQNGDEPTPQLKTAVRRNRSKKLIGA